MLFLAFLASKWRWLLYFLAIIFAVLLITQGLDYASSLLARRKATKQARAAITSQAARAAAEPRHRHNFDSTFYSQAGRRRELAHTLAKIKHLDDSLSRSLPAVPYLPAQPPRP